MAIKFGTEDFEDAQSTSANFQGIKDVLEGYKNNILKKNTFFNVFNDEV